MSSKKVFIQILRFILLLISIYGIWYLIREWRLKPFKQRLLNIADQVIAANARFEQLTNFERYFAYRDETLFLGAYQEVRKIILPHYNRAGLSADQEAAFKLFSNNYDGSGTIRKNYNDLFVLKEAEKFALFFSGLEKYPLSGDQIEAIICDEDNNLVIAGAGTGKTTTISGKIAYLLEKGIARPEELLIISFTNNAVKEMHERCMRFCQHIPAAKALEVKTFNGFGFLVSRTCSPEEILLAFDGNDESAKTFLQNQFDDLYLKDANFQRKATNYLAYFDRPKTDETKFKTKDEYLTHEQSFKNVTLDGKKVNSKQEVEIGNFFCLFNVNYEYERHYPLKEEDRNPAYGTYQPDFYLPDYGIWHEHFGIGRNGEVADWFKARPPHQTASETYQAGINWKESIHAKYQTKLIKTYSYESIEGDLIPNLKEKLIAEGVELRQRNAEEMLELLKKSEQYKDFIQLLYTFMSLMKSNGKTPDDLHASLLDKRFRVFLDVLKELYGAYDKHLKAIPAVDYNDMINHATEHFKKGRFQKPYKYILVDEFQDMSLGRYELLKAIRLQNPGVKIYAVGDDWQSIFRFTGSDISIITQFEKHFGYTSQTAILKTYRFNEQILQTSSQFIQKNPSQILKNLTANLKAPEGHTSFEFIPMAHAGTKEQFLGARLLRLLTILEDIKSKKPDATVYLIGRYRFNAPRDMAELFARFPDLSITFYTAHGVKGMTCDYAILLDVDSGTLGFPSEIADDELLNHLLHEGDQFENAEERRVFYVAITRARFKNYLIYNEIHPSKFLLELQGDAGIATELDVKKCPECQGKLVLRKGPFSDFYGCVHYPRCHGRLRIESLAKPTPSANMH